MSLSLQFVQWRGSPECLSPGVSPGVYAARPSCLKLGISEPRINLMTEGKNKVVGWLFSFGDERILESLDFLEDYQEKRVSELNEYNRQQVPVYDLAGNDLGQAWCYVMSLAKVREKNGILVLDSQWNSKF